MNVLTNIMVSTTHSLLFSIFTEGFVTEKHTFEGVTFLPSSGTKNKGTIKLISGYMMATSQEVGNLRINAL